MTPREIIQRNLNRTDPERIGFSFGGGRLNDFVGCGLGPSATYQPRRWTEGNVEYHDDEWGNVWHRLVDRSAGGEIFKPALESWDMLADYELPDLAAPSRFDRAREVFSADARRPCAEAERFRVASIPGFPFAICRYLRKMEVYFQDLILHRDEIDVLHERVTSLLEQVIVGMGEAGADGLTFCEDWGIQDRLLVSPTQWREIFKPLFQRLCGVAHEHGVAVLMHSCGCVWDILDDLAEVGVNAFQFDQPALYGIERLAGKLQSLGCCLWAPVDIQKVLPTGDRDYIEAEARKMVKLFGGDHGGFIAKNYGDLHGIGVEPEWDQWAYEAIVEAAGGSWGQGREGRQGQRPAPA
jgi:hypothetical protein